MVMPNHYTRIKTFLENSFTGLHSINLTNLNLEMVQLTIFYRIFKSIRINTSKLSSILGLWLELLVFVVTVLWKGHLLLTTTSLHKNKLLTMLQR